MTTFSKRDKSKAIRLKDNEEWFQHFKLLKQLPEQEQMEYQKERIRNQPKSKKIVLPESQKDQKFVQNLKQFLQNNIGLMFFIACFIYVISFLLLESSISEKFRKMNLFGLRNEEFDDVIKGT